MAAASGLIFGRDILFTNGPLGYLFFPIGLNPMFWIEAVAFRILIHTLFYLVLLFLVLKSEHHLFNAVIFAFSGTIIESVLQESYVLAAVFLLIAIYLIVEERYSYFPLLSAFAATTPFFKLDIGLAVFATMILGTGFLYFKGHHRLALLSLFAWTSVFILAGIVLTKSFETLASFVVGSYQVAIGFGPAMSLDGPLWEVYIGIIAGVVFMLHFIREVRTKNFSPVVILSLGFLFFAFKEGFVRQDGSHVIVFFGASALFFGLAQIKERNKVIRNGCILMLVLLLVCQGMAIYPGNFIIGGRYSPTNFTDTIALMSNPSVSSRMFSSSLLYVRSQYPLSNNTIKLLSNNSVDVFPWDVAMLLAYGMTWDPRPVFQSYSAYTSYLDNLNSRHFLDSNAPEFVLYEPASIDGRYPLFDEPLTIRVLMCHYQVSGFDETFMVLRRGENYCGSPVVIEDVESTFGRTVTVPANYSGYVFAQVQIQYNLIGTIRNLLYKAPPVFVQLNFSDGSTGTYRFVFENGMDGLVVSAVPNDLFGGVIKQIREISFITPGAYAFDSHIQVTFVEVPTSQTDQEAFANSYFSNQTQPSWQPSTGNMLPGSTIRSTVRNYPTKAYSNDKSNFRFTWIRWVSLLN